MLGSDHEVVGAASFPSGRVLFVVADDQISLAVCCTRRSHTVKDMQVAALNHEILHLARPLGGEAGQDGLQGGDVILRE